ncbi:MAG: hypothetical protein AAFO89_12040 [Planctomycetota bacterium]
MGDGGGVVVFAQALEASGDGLRYEAVPVAEVLKDNWLEFDGRRSSISGGLCPRNEASPFESIDECGDAAAGQAELVGELGGRERAVLERVEAPQICSVNV